MAGIVGQLLVESVLYYPQAVLQVRKIKTYPKAYPKCTKRIHDVFTDSIPLPIVHTYEVVDILLENKGKLTNHILPKVIYNEVDIENYLILHKK